MNEQTLGKVKVVANPTSSGANTNQHVFEPTRCDGFEQQLPHVSEKNTHLQHYDLHIPGVSVFLLQSPWPEHAI